MSLKAMAWAYEQRTGDPGLKALLLAIANFADEEGYCWPARALLADMIEVSEKTVSRYSQRLLDLGLVGIEQRTLGNGARSTNGFRLPLAARQLTLTPPGQTVPTPRDTGVPTPGTQLSPDPRDIAVSRPPGQLCPDHITIIEPSREPSIKQGALLAERPDWLPPEWEEFVADRKERRKPLTSRAMKLAVKTLAELRAQGQDVSAVLTQSIRNGWAGLFPLRADDRRGMGVTEANAKLKVELRRKYEQESSHEA